MHEIVVLIDKIHWFSLDRIEELVFFLNGTSKNLPYRGVILILYTTPTECLRHCAENAMDVASFWFSEKKIVTWSLRHITNADEKEVECTISLSLILSYITRFSVSRLTKITFISIHIFSSLEYGSMRSCYIRMRVYEHVQLGSGSMHADDEVT